LYQAIAHGCSAGRHSEVLREVYMKRICRYKFNDDRTLIFFSKTQGAFGSDLAAISRFFVSPYGVVVELLTSEQRSFVFGETGYCLMELGRFTDALPALQMSLQTEEVA